jgi:hypothetical protein
MLSRSSLALLTLAALTASSAAQAPAPEPQVLEGYVFGKFTGVPLENVVVVVGYSENGSTTRERTITDANGFYRFDGTGVEEIRIAFLCTSRRIANPAPLPRTSVPFRNTPGVLPVPSNHIPGVLPTAPALFDPNRNTVEGTVNLPESWTGTLQRNVYLSTPAVPTFSKCDIGPRTTR